MRHLIKQIQIKMNRIFIKKYQLIKIKRNLTIEDLYKNLQNEKNNYFKNRRKELNNKNKDKNKDKNKEIKLKNKKI
jgi:hypothetical protein